MLEMEVLRVGRYIVEKCITENRPEHFKALRQLTELAKSILDAERRGKRDIDRRLCTQEPGERHWKPRLKMMQMKRALKKARKHTAELIAEKKLLEERNRLLEMELQMERVPPLTTGLDF